MYESGRVFEVRGLPEAIGRRQELLVAFWACSRILKSVNGMHRKEEGIFGFFVKL
jgi:hypothetical protein